jgi:citrate lyase beta subunit
MRRPHPHAPVRLRIVTPAAIDAGVVDMSRLDAVVVTADAKSADAPPREEMQRLLALQRIIRDWGRDAAATPELHVRIGASLGGFDLDHVRMLCSPGLSAIHLPGPASAAQVEEVSSLLDMLEVAVGVPAGTVGLHPWVATPRDLITLRPALDASGRMRAPVFDGARLAVALGVVDDGATLLALRAQVVLESSVGEVGAPLELVFAGEDAVGPAADRSARIGFGGIVEHEEFCSEPRSAESRRPITTGG